MHWTYEKFEKDSDLHQGDLLEPNEALLDLFKDVHPYFAQEKYRGFLILTQSCDMVRRQNKGGQCGATHINLSVIRSLRDIISDSLKDKFGYLAPGIYDQQKKKIVSALAERLVNQNENTLGLFYLHPDLDSGISIPSVAVLRVAISVKAALHYDNLVSARVGSLSTEFQPKLGWMVGNLYSRVGVTDWKEKSEDEKVNSEKNVITEILSFTRDEPIWLGKKIYKKILKEKSDFDTLSISEQEKIIHDFQPPPPKDKIIEVIIKIVKKAVPKIEAKCLENIKTRLINDEELEAKMKKYGVNQ